MKQLFFILLLLGFYTIFSQTISGKILDKQENPIVYATVQIGDNFGVITNEEGSFEIDIKKFKPKDKVIISYLGFKQLTFDLKDFESKKYYLVEDINQLDAIFVSGEKLTVDEIIQKVQENSSENYVHTNLKHQIFHRITNSNKYKKFDFDFDKSNIIKKSTLKKLNKSMDSMFAKMINKTTKYYTDALSNYYVGKTKTKLDVVKRTILLNKQEDQSDNKMLEVFLKVFSKHLEKGETYKVKSGLFKVTDSLDVEEDFKMNDYEDEYETKYLKSNYNDIIEDNSITDDSKLDFIFKTKRYDYDLKNLIYFQGDLVYEIAFKPKRGAAKLEGIFYVNSDDFAVVKAKFGLAKGKISRKLNLKLVLGFKMIENIYKSEILFQKNKNGKYQFKLITQEVGGYAYIKRPLKFTKNRRNKSEEKKKLKMSFLMEANQYKKHELFFLDTEEILNTAFTEIKEKEKYTVDYIKKYSSANWKGYHVLSPVQEIRDYDTGE